MRSVVFCRLLPLAVLLSLLLTSGCALNATTDFGPGDEPRHQSVSGGVGPFSKVYDSDRHHDEGYDPTAPPQ